MSMSKAFPLAVVLAFWGQAWALPIGGGEPPDPPTHSGPITPAPSNLTVRARAENQVIIDFNCGGNADAHEGWRRLGNKSFARVSFASGCSFKDTTVSPETSYCYKVRALNDTHEAWSSMLCVTTLAPTTAPRAPTVWLDTRWPDIMQVVYRDNATNENYLRVYRRRVGESAWSIVQTVTRNGADRSTGEMLSFNDFGLVPETAYEYIVQAGYEPIDATQLARRSNSVAVVESTRVLSFSPAGGCTGTGTEGVCDASFALSNGMQLTYYRNHPINSPNTNIKRLVVAVHGVTRDAWVPLDAVTQSAAFWGVLPETLIVAPQFRDSQWGDWVKGDQSYVTFPGWMPTISSFAAIDELVMAIANPTRFPNLREIVIAGHSGGGQVTQRYAATSRIEESRPGYRYRYVVMNPNSYMYLNQWRRSATGSFIIPTGCTGYNEYKFGLEDRNPYASQLTDPEIVGQYPRKEIVYVLGANDTDPNGDYVNQDCPYSLQGPQRLARGTNYYEHMLKYFPDNYHRRLVVPGVGHQRYQMYGSMEAAVALFF